jgi:hypothetical protein
MAALAAARAAKDLSRSDEELARQLQEEENRRAAVGRPSGTNTRTSSTGSASGVSAQEINAVFGTPREPIAPTALSGKKLEPSSRSSTVSRRSGFAGKEKSVLQSFDSR